MAATHRRQNILQVMKTEINATHQAIRDGRQPHEAYDELGDTLSGEWNRITGGGSVASPLFPLGRYLKLAASNWDHFGEWALLAYKAGHTVALQQAVVAHQSGRDQDLELAYAMNAFADHFLTDLFSAGHLRVPRKQLADSVTPSDVGSLISRFMHDEDSQYGLKVSNARGERWNCYGDKRYFDSLDDSNRRQVKQAVQQSADEVFATYLSGTVVPVDSYAALASVPDLAKVEDSQDRLNFAPLFALKGKTVLRRKDVNDLNDRSQSDSWWGWSTYLLLKDYQPNKPAGYLNPPDTAPTIQADGWQSRTASEPNWLPGHAVRYAFSYSKGLDESYIGPWTAYTELTDRFANPERTGQYPLRCDRAQCVPPVPRWLARADRHPGQPGNNLYRQPSMTGRSAMTFTVRLELASGQSLKDMPLELLADGVAVARAKADETGEGG